MNHAFMLYDVAPGPETAAVGGIFAIGFFLLFLVVAFVAYKALKKVVKMGVRIAIVAVILLIAMVGSASLFIFTYPAAAAHRNRGRRQTALANSWTGFPACPPSIGISSRTGFPTCPCPRRQPRKAVYTKGKLNCS